MKKVETLSLVERAVSSFVELNYPIPPKLANGRDVDLRRLYIAVKDHGGRDSVNQSDSWTAVAKEIGLEPADASSVNLIQLNYLEGMNTTIESVVGVMRNLMAEKGGEMSGEGWKSPNFMRKTQSPVMGMNKIPQLLLLQDNGNLASTLPLTRISNAASGSGHLKEYHSDVVLDIDKDDVHLLLGELQASYVKEWRNESCSIFRVPPNLRSHDSAAYEPKIICIGPYHMGKHSLMEKRKMALVRRLFSTVPHSTVVTCFEAVKSLVTRAKSCYADELNIEEREFVKMLLVDGCFLVGLLMKYRKRNSEEPTYWVGFEEHGEEPLRGSSNNSRFIWGQIFRDLMKIENQIPFFVVEKLYNLLVPPDEDHVSIIELAHSYLKEYLELVVCCGKNFNLENQKVQHLFDLLYQIQVTGDWTLNHKETPSDKRWSCKWIQCATKLRDCGIRFHQRKDTSILDVKFQKGVMEIPSISMFDGVVPILKNLIAYEQCYSPVQYFTTYASFMDFLIDTPKDVKVLCDANIIELSFSNKDEVSAVFNNLQRGTLSNTETSNYLARVMYEVNRYSESGQHRWREILVTNYCDTPWSTIRLGTAIVLVLCALLQTFYTVYTHYHK